jgi:ribosomal protein RSM22 (predicted rRNA methylase)
MLLRNLVVKRCNWKAPIALPPQLAERRAAFLAHATGPQLKRLCQKPQLSDRDAALLDVWRRLAPRYAVARRVITDCGVAPTNALVVGAGAATVAALPSSTRCTVVEATPEREAAAQQLLDDPGIEYLSNLAAVATRQPSPEQAFDFVIATDHFVNNEDPETHLAVLWGCVAEDGLLAVVERESTPIREARSRLRSEGTPLEPSTAELLPQCFAEPVEGPPPRSTRKADAGTALKRRAQRVEKFSSCVVRRGAGAGSDDGRRRRAIVTSTPLKRAGHVVVDARDERGAERRLTLSRARLREMGTPFKDARRLTVGSVLSWDE